MESERRYLDAPGRVAKAAVVEGTLVLADGDELLRLAQTAPKGETPTMELIHTCYRITDPDRSVAFYQALGFEERRRLPIRDEAINIFMGLPGDGDRLELTYNFGVDSYDLGTGYGHVAVTVENIHATLERLAEQCIEPEKPPYTVREGGSLLCFVRDPDGYRIELIERG
jgi:lactoylglutathione lyase